MSNISKKTDINKIIPRSSSKMDYVPECLLFKNNSALPL